FSSRRRHTRSYGDWSSDVCSSDLGKRIESAENPNSEKHPSVGEQPCDVAGRSNDAGSDGIADGRGHAKPHAENLEQAAAADYGLGVSCRRGFRCARQWEVSRVRESQPSYRGDRKMQAGSGEFECYWFGNVLSRGANEVPF